MNKRLILIPALFMAATSLIFTGCSKDEDTTAPVITLNDPSYTEIELQEAYVEPGATAIDGEDGTVNVSISGTVDNDLKGNYTITYTATDEAGNTATEERTVTVVNSADFLGGSYIDASDVCGASGSALFDAFVTPSDSENGEFDVTNFGAFGQSITVTCVFNSATNKITATTPQSLGGTTNLTEVFSASGIISNSPVTFQIVYEWNDGGSSEICTSK